MSIHDIVVVGASAGGVEALTQLAVALPPDLPAALFVVLHIPHDNKSALPHILNRAGPLHASHSTDGEPIKPGRIYVAPPGCHLTVQPGHVELNSGPKVHGVRPAVDVLFRSAAQAYGARVVGVVLSGALNDGAAGLAAIKGAGGLAIAQDPNEAFYSGMPESAIANVAMDYVLPVTQIGHLITHLAHEPAEVEGVTVISDPEDQLARITEDLRAQERGERLDQPSVLTCPECGGVLWELREGNLVQYRCHVGHAYSIDTLNTEQNKTLEAALWTALRSLTEKEVLAQRLEARAQRSGHKHVAEQYARQAQEAARAGAVLRELLKDYWNPEHAPA